MKLFDVYPVADITPVKAKGSFLWDENGNKYIDLYGGHAVISIGHSHRNYISAITSQLDHIGFYSNSVKIPLQKRLAGKLAEISGYPEHQLFLCNSGAEANENAIKLASFHTGRKKIVAFSSSFHGRTSMTVAATDDIKIRSEINQTQNVTFHPFNQEERLEEVITNETAAVIIEGIQGVGGIKVPTISFLKKIKSLCIQTGTLLIIDEIQSGCGRTGKFFAHQYSGVEADLITMAKGMGNGFPVGGVLISSEIKPWYGMLGTTFGGNYLACAAAISVLDTIEEEGLLQNANILGQWMINELKRIRGVKEVRGKGFMIGIELETEVISVRNSLMKEYGYLTGISGNQTLRILPALNINKKTLQEFLTAFTKVMIETTEKIAA